SSDSVTVVTISSGDNIWLAMEDILSRIVLMLPSMLLMSLCASSKPSRRSLVSFTVSHPEPWTVAVSASASVRMLTCPGCGAMGATAVSASAPGASSAYTTVTGVPASACSASHSLNAVTVDWLLKNQMFG